MNRALVTIYVPHIDEKYDIFIPINKTVANVTFLISKTINELSDGSYIVKDNTLLYNKETGKAYEGNKTIKESLIKNGTQLILY